MKIKKILFPTDFSEVSHKTLEQAVYLAKTFNAELDIVYVVFGKMQLASTYVLQDTLNEFTKELESGVHKHMEEFTSECTFLKEVNFTTKILTGSPHVEIVDYAEKTKVDLIVMSTHGYTGLKHMVLGSTAEKVIARVHCPVFIVKTS